MLITVAICTWNRASSLARTLDSCVALISKGAIDWELLVVDNKSTDETPQVVASYSNRLPIRYAFEGMQGLSNARNRAVKEAAGALILWTDDDVLVDPGWLAAYADALANFPQAAFFGGPIVAEFVAPPPAWLRDNLDILGGALALRDLGAEIKPIISLAEQPFGANMAMRREALRDHPFDPKLGRTGATLLSGEETLLFEQLLAEGRTGMWIGTARVRHVVPAERMTFAYIRSYFQGIGRAKLITKPDRKQLRVAARLPKWRRRLKWERMILRLARRRDTAWAKRLVRCAELEAALDHLTDS